MRNANIVQLHNLCYYYNNTMQVSKHRRTVCTHQVRDCEFKDSGCQFKVSIEPFGDNELGTDGFSDPLPYL